MYIVSMMYLGICPCFVITGFCIYVGAGVRTGISLQALVRETYHCLAPVFPAIWAIVSLQSQMQTHR